MDSEQKNEEISDHLLHKYLEMLAPAFRDLRVKEARIFIDAANECLKGTPFMYFLMGDGVKVMLRAQMMERAKAMFNKPMGDYS